MDPPHPGAGIQWKQLCHDRWLRGLCANESQNDSSGPQGKAVATQSVTAAHVVGMRISEAYLRTNKRCVHASA